MFSRSPGQRLTISSSVGTRHRLGLASGRMGKRIQGSGLCLVGYAQGANEGAGDMIDLLVNVEDMRSRSWSCKIISSSSDAASDYDFQDIVP